MDNGSSVEDDGPGIPVDERDAGFESRYSTARGGTGFGSSLGKQVVEAHDWEITITEGAKGGACDEITGVQADE